MLAFLTTQVFNTLLLGGWYESKNKGEVSAGIAKMRTGRGGAGVGARMGGNGGGGGVMERGGVGKAALKLLKERSLCDVCGCACGKWGNDSGE